MNKNGKSKVWTDKKIATLDREKVMELLPWAKYCEQVGEERIWFLVAGSKSDAIKFLLPAKLPLGVAGEIVIPGYFHPLYDYDLQLAMKDNRVRVAMATGFCQEQDGELRFLFRSPYRATQCMLVASYPEGAEAAVTLFKHWAGAEVYWETQMPGNEKQKVIFIPRHRFDYGEEDMNNDLWMRGATGASPGMMLAPGRTPEEINDFCWRMTELVDKEEKPRSGYVASLSPVRTVGRTATGVAVEIFGVTRWYQFTQEGYLRLVRAVSMAKHLAGELAEKPEWMPGAYFASDEEYFAQTSFFWNSWF